MSYPVPLAECARMIFSFLFAAFVFCLQHFGYLQYTSFICNARFYLQRTFFYLQRTFFYLQRTFFICSVLFLFAAFLFCLQRFFIVCSVSFLFAAFLFCLQRFPCGPSYVSIKCTFFESIYFYAVRLRSTR